MAYTTSATLEGLMSTINADVQAIFKTQSDLFNAVYAQSAGNAVNVTFQSQAAPVSILAHTEGTLATASAVTIGAVACALETYPVLVSVSNRALGSGADVSLSIARQMAGNLAGTMDYKVTSLFSSFTGGTVGATGSALTMSDLITSISKLDSTKYAGTKTVVLHPGHFAPIAKDLIAVSGMTRDEIVSRGYIANVFGAEVYVSPWVATDDNNDAVSACFIKEAGIGLGYREPVIDINFQPNLQAVGVDFLGESYFKAVMLNAGAGIKLVGDVG